MTKVARAAAFCAVVCVCVVFPLAVYSFLLGSGADTGDE